MVWGSSALRSCSSLLEKVERNEIQDLVLLSTKDVTVDDWDRLIRAIQSSRDLASPPRKLRSIGASGHAISASTLLALGKAIAESSSQIPWTLLAIGDQNLGANGGLESLVSGLLVNDGKSLQLQALDLSFKGLTSKCFSEILKLCMSCQALLKLDLSRNPGLMDEYPSDKSMQGTSTCWFPHVVELNMASNEINGQRGKELLENLSLGGTPCCRVLNLSQNPIGRQPLNVLGLSPPSLEELNLAHCNLDDQSLASFSGNSVQLKVLHTLDLSNNQLTTLSVTFLAQWLAENSPVLQHLNVSGNPLTSTGIHTLIEQGLSKRANPLVSLDLSATQCGCEGAVKAVEKSQVSTLRLFDNQLGSPGFEALTPCLAGGHATLISLDLAGNGASEESVVTLLRGLLVAENEPKRVSKLTTIVVGGNKGGPQLEEIVVEIHKIYPNLDIARDRIRS